MRFRVSAANLAPVIRLASTRTWRYFGLVNRSNWEKKGLRVLTPPGGALLVRPEGQAVLERECSARFLEAPTPEGIDARFMIEEVFLEPVLSLLSARSPEHLELEVDRELREELLTREIPSLQTDPLLTAADLSGLSIDYLGAYRQPPPLDGKGTSAREVDEPTRRLFFCFALTVEEPVWARLEASPLVELLTEEEVASTEGGRKKGQSLRGSIIGDNFFSVPDEWRSILLL